MKTFLFSIIFILILSMDKRMMGFGQQNVQKHGMCGPNEDFVSCPNPCPPSCERPKIDVCPAICLRLGCQCKPGLLRGPRGHCIRPQQCPVSPCGMNEELVHCPSKCPPTCKHPQSLCKMMCQKDDFGCQCKRGLVRDTHGHCVLPEQCPHTPDHCGENERWTDHDCVPPPKCQLGQCPNNPKVQCPKICFDGGCICEEGFLRNKDGECVHPDQCDVPPRVIHERDNTSVFSFGGPTNAGGTDNSNIVIGSVSQKGSGNIVGNKNVVGQGNVVGSNNQIGQGNIMQKGQGNVMQQGKGNVVQQGQNNNMQQGRGINFQRGRGNSFMQAGGGGRGTNFMQGGGGGRGTNFMQGGGGGRGTNFMQGSGGGGGNNFMQAGGGGNNFMQGGGPNNLQNNGQGGGPNNFQNSGQGGGPNNFQNSGQGGGPNNFQNSGQGGGPNNFQNSGQGGGPNNFQNSGQGGGPNNFQNSGSDGGANNFQNSG